MHTGGTMNAGQAPYQKAANDECRICGGTRAILTYFFFSSFTNGSKIHLHSLTFNAFFFLLLIITRTSQALVTGKRSYIESCCCVCVCVCVCCHCFSSGVKIKRKREREDT